MEETIALEYESREIRLKMWPPEPKNLLDRSCNIYGGSGTGKTVLLREILCLLQHEISCFYVFSGTAGVSSDSFFTSDVVPAPMLNSSLDMNIIKNILDLQELQIELEHKSRDVEYVMSLVDKWPDSSKAWTTTVAEFRRLSVRFVKLRNAGKVRAEALKEFQTRFCVRALKAIRDQIEAGRVSEPPYGELDQVIIKDKPAPRVCIIIDDLADAVQQLKGEELKQLTKMYIKGRHYRLTFFMVLQDITFLKAALRSNGMINCFTCSDSARKFMGNASSGIDRASQKKALAIVERVFEDNERFHNVLVYLKDAREHFCFTRARDPSKMPVIRLCSERYWRIANEIERNKASRIQVSSDNAFRNRI